jgi:type I restriction enzyme R subunit
VQGPREDVTCNEYVLPKLRAAGWTEQQIIAEYWVRRPGSLSGDFARRTVANGRADYVLEIVPGLPIAVVEAKREYLSAGDAVGQAVEYAQALDVPLAYATNGVDIRLRDRVVGSEADVETFMTPIEAWAAYVAYHHLADEGQQALMQPFSRALLNADGAVKEPRYYQRVAIHRTLKALLAGERRLLLLMATGTGKTFTALQLVAKLRSYWAHVDPRHNHRVLYLADRDWLIRQPYGQFAQAFRPTPSRASGALAAHRETSTLRRTRHSIRAPIAARCRRSSGSIRPTSST